MRIALTVAVSAALLAALSGHAQANQTCISKATEALPRIAGLVIKKSRARPVPAAILATWKGQTRPIIVDVDTVAAGAAQTYSLHVRDNAGVGIRAAHDELVEHRDDLFHRSRASFRRAQCFSFRDGSNARST